MYFVYWVTGSCLSGNRNAGLSGCESLEAARAEVADIKADHHEALVIIIHGEEVERA